MNLYKKFVVALTAVSFLSAFGHALDLGKIGVKKGKGGAIPFNFDAPAAGRCAARRRIPAPTGTAGCPTG
jgi:hypothetical protein